MALYGDHPLGKLILRLGMSPHIPPIRGPSRGPSVRHEPVQALVGQRVPQQLIQYLGG